jgi:hypothetical protein
MRISVPHSLGRTKNRTNRELTHAGNRCIRRENGVLAKGTSNLERIVTTHWPKRSAHNLMLTQ